MNQRSSVKSPKKSSPNQVKSALQEVLGCLDVNLEAEMNQYRRQRQRSQQWVPPSSVGQPSRQSIDLISPTVEGQQASVPPASVEAKTRPTIDFETRLPNAQLAIPSNTSKPNLTSIDGTVKHPGDSQNSPNNYLESSEELLRSLDEEEKSEPQVEHSLVSSLFTPLGLTSMLLFLLSCFALSYTVINPSIWANLGFSGWSKQNPKPATSPTNKVANSNQEELPKAPNLASKEFFELDLSTLSNVKPIPSPIPLPSIKPSVPPIPQAVVGVSLPSPKIQPGANDQGLDNLQKALLPKTPPSPVAPKPLVPIPSAVKPGVQKSGTPTAAIAKPSAVSPGIPIKAQDGYYYVVVDYGNEQSLEQAQKVVPDAYVREFPNGVKIQMGALLDAKSAEQLVKELQEKGVKAKYYQP